MLQKSGAGRDYPQTDHQIMFEEDQRDALSRASNSTAAILNALGLGQDIREK
jgi:hypothetical protein